MITSRKSRRRASVMTLLTVMSLTLSACSHYSEPEQIYAVSAIGFDGAGELLRVTVEIPVVSDGELTEAAPWRFSQTAETVVGALKQISSGLSGNLIFSHCAAVVLGESLSARQMREIFAFAGEEEGLPLAAEVVTCREASELLAATPLSSPAVGYEITEILEQMRRQSGAEMPCGIYELRAVVSPSSPVAIPRFVYSEEQESRRLRFDGLEIMRAGEKSFSLSAEECVPYAILTDTYRAMQWRRISCQWSVSQAGEGLQIRLRLCLETDSGGSEGAETMGRELCDGVEALFARVRDTTGEDLFGLSERIGTDKAALEAELDRTALIADAEIRIGR